MCIRDSIKITPTFENIEEDAVYAWREEGRILGTEPTLVFSSNELGTHHLTLTVTTPSGTAKANAKVEVVEFQLPVISIEGGGEPIIEVGEKYELTPCLLYTSWSGWRRWSRWSLTCYRGG